MSELCTICDTLVEEDENCDCRIVEECPRCLGAEGPTGTLINEEGLMIICDKCDGKCYIDHECGDDNVEA